MLDSTASGRAARQHTEEYVSAKVHDSGQAAPAQAIPAPKGDEPVTLYMFLLGCY